MLVNKVNFQIRLWIYLSLLFSNGCSTTYTLSQIREHTNEMYLKIDGPFQRISADLSHKSQIISGLKTNRADFSKFPFNSLEQRFKQLNELYQQLNSHHQKVESKLHYFQGLERALGRWPNKEDQEKNVLEYKAFAAEVKENLERDVELYLLVSKEFTDLANKSDVYLLDKKELEQNLMVMANYLNRDVKLKRGTLNRIQKRLSNSKREENSEKISIVKRMKNILQEIDWSSQQIRIVGVELKNVKTEKDKFVVGPHMRSHGYIVNLKAQEKRINELITTYNNLKENLLY